MPCADECVYEKPFPCIGGSLFIGAPVVFLVYAKSVIVARVLNFVCMNSCSKAFREIFCNKIIAIK